MIAESKAEEKDVMVKLIMNFVKIIVIICNCKSDLVEKRGIEYNYINYTKGRSYDVQK